MQENRTDSFQGPGVLKRLFASVSFLFLGACNSGDPGTDPIAVSGSVTLGPLRSASVTVYALQSDGARGGATGGPFVTDAAGRWSGSVQAAASTRYEVVATGGEYTDEAGGVTVVLTPGEALTGVLDSDRPEAVAVTPVTHAVMLAARHIAGTYGIGIQQAVRDAERDAERAFDFDPVRTLPDAAAVGDAGRRYAALLGGISLLVQEDPEVRAFPPFAATMALAGDLVDGRLDGRDARGDPITVPGGPAPATVMPALDASGIGALVDAANRYAVSRPALADVRLTQPALLAFGSGGGRLLDGELRLAVDGAGYFQLASGGDVVYARSAVFAVDVNGFVVDAQGRRLRAFMADASGNVTGAVDELRLPTDGTVLHGLEISADGRVKLRRPDGGVTTLGQLVLAVFAGPGWLLEAASGAWTPTADSGPAFLGTSGTGAMGDVLTHRLSGGGAVSGFALSVAGDAFLVLNAGGTQVYARGATVLSHADRFFLTPDRWRIRAHETDAQGGATGALIDLALDPNAILPPVPTSSVALRLGLDAAAAVPAAAFDPTDTATYDAATTVAIYDSLGAGHELRVFLRRLSGYDWETYCYIDGELQAGPDPLVFDADGALDVSTYSAVVNLPAYTPGNGAVPLYVDVDFAGTVQRSASFAVLNGTQNGYSTAALTEMAVTADGYLRGRYADGREISFARVALARFNRPDLLSGRGDGTYAESLSSGAPVLGMPADGRYPALDAAALFY